MAVPEGKRTESKLAVQTKMLRILESSCKERKLIQAIAKDGYIL